MFLLISWRWVRKVVAVMAMTRTIAMTWTVVVSAFRKVEAILPPGSLGPHTGSGFLPI